MNQSSETPKLIVFAGPNGSGKSTVTKIFQAQPTFPSNYINPDEIAKTLEGEDLKMVAYEAAILADSLREEALKNRESFAFETVMSHPDKLNILVRAKELGYRVEIIFVATSKPEINVARVLGRVLEGGHDVPENKIVERYYRTLELLPLAIEIVDRVDLFDNTEIIKLSTSIERGEVIQKARSVPQWVENILQAIEGRAIERIRIEELSNNELLTLMYADTKNGKYVGRIREISPHYIAQETGENTLVLHERAIVKAAVEPNQDFRIAYSKGNVAASIRPSLEDRVWAESILDSALRVFEAAREGNRINIVSRGIEVFQGKSYKLQLNQNNRVFSIFTKENDRNVAAFDLEEREVIAAMPTISDRTLWNRVVNSYRAGQINNREKDIELE